MHTYIQVGTFVNLGFELPGDEDGFTYEVSYIHTYTQVGTFVNLGFERSGDEDGFTYEVSLMRGNAEYFAQLQTKNTMQEEVGICIPLERESVCVYMNISRECGLRTCSKEK
jgi:hypothetical protein